MAEKLDLDALEKNVFGCSLCAVDAYDAIVKLIARIRELESSVDSLSATLSNVDKSVRETLGIDPSADDALPELVADWLESASQPGGEAEAVLCISAKELADVLELAAPDAFPMDFDRDHEQMETEMCIGRLTGSLDDDGADTGPGLFAWYTEYPEEGVIPLRLDRDVRASIDALRAAPSAGNGGAEGYAAPTTGHSHEHP